jgi:hypothetical protein
VNFLPDVQPVGGADRVTLEIDGVPVTSCAWWIARVGAADMPTVVCVIRGAKGGKVLCVKPTDYKRRPGDQRAHWTKAFRLSVSVFVQPASDEAIDAVKAAHGDPLIHHGANP